MVAFAYVLIAVVGLAILPIQALGQQPPQSASEVEIRDFLTKLYSHNRGAPQVFDGRMVSTLRENRRLLAGDLGALDYDPLCQCQDDGGMHVEIGRIQMTGPSTANSTAALHFPDGTKSVGLSLAKENGQWRIHDIMSKNAASLFKLLTDENRKLAAASSTDKPPLRDGPMQVPPPQGLPIQIRLGSLRSPEAARDEWARIKRENNDLLGSLTAVAIRADLGDKGIYYRIQAGPFGNLIAAERLCDELRRRNLGCVVAR